MSISNNFLEKKLYIISFSEKKIYDLTLVAINILEETECIIISKTFDKSLINNLMKLNSKLIFEEELISNQLISVEIPKLFDKYKSITHFTKIKEVFFHNQFMNDYLKLKKKKINIILVPTVKEVISTFNKLKIPLTDRRRNSSINFIESNTINKLNIVLKDPYLEKIVVKIDSQIQLEKIKQKLKNNNNYNEIYMSSYKKINLDNKDFKDEVNLLFKNNESIYLILERN